MNGNNLFYGRAGLWASSALLGVLTGCTTYIEGPRPSPVYLASPPPVEVREVAVAPPPPVEAPVVVESVVEIRTERDFYEPLNSYGHWVDVADYGRCWVPDRVDRDWRPYTNGHWQRTEAGWYWVSDEPWGWATYHYGRWDWRPEFGWLWVPQTQWAPAWVSFHQGGGYTGWAPLHPSARIRDGGLEAPERTDQDRGLVFVDDRRFLEPVRPATVVVNNTTIINQTVNITSIKVVNNTIINEGPRIAVMEKASGRPIEAVPVRELRRKQEAAVIAARPIPAVNQNAGPAAGRPVNDSRNYKAPTEAERRAAEAQAQAEAQRKAKEAELKAAQSEAQGRGNAINAQVQAEAQRQAKEAEAKAAQAEAARRAEAANSQAQAETQRKAKEAELKAAQAEVQRRINATNAQAQAEVQRKAKESEAKAAQAEATHRVEAANSQAQVEAQRKAKEAELKAAQAEAERRTNEARAKALAMNQKPAAARGEDAITSRIAAALAADPALQSVHVVRSNGIVHLSGAVYSADQKKRAGELAQKIETTHPVQNNLTVRP